MSTTTSGPDSLVQRLREERERLGDEFRLPVILDLDTALCIVGNLQLALRHPGNRGASAEVARTTIDGIIERTRTAGYAAHAQLMKLGEDPRYDV